MAQAPLFIQGYQSLCQTLFKENRNGPVEIIPPSPLGSKIFDLFLLNQGFKEVVVEFGYSHVLEHLSLQVWPGRRPLHDPWSIARTDFGSFLDFDWKVGDVVSLTPSPGAFQACGDFRIVKVRERRIFFEPQREVKEEEIFAKIGRFKVFWSVKVRGGAGMTRPLQSALDPHQLPWLFEKGRPFIVKVPLVARLPKNVRGVQGDVVIQGRIGNYGQRATPLSSLTG